MRAVLAGSFTHSLACNLRQEITITVPEMGDAGIFAFGLQ
jgi:hypothetical protein